RVIPTKDSQVAVFLFFGHRVSDWNHRYASSSVYGNNTTNPNVNTTNQKSHGYKPNNVNITG
ncbi:MAG: hypothetical protein II560_02350, partial [Bacteroidales bacterium]|nr:hypothetical protein [Bacteroidales bacterium]